MELIHLRQKRFAFNANSTCGHIAYCSPELHDRNLVLNHSLADDPRCSKFGVILTIIINVILSVVIVFGNSMIIYVMNTSSKFRNPQGIFKTSLAVFDLLVGLLVIPSTIYNEITIMLLPLGRSYLSYIKQFGKSISTSVFGMLFNVCIAGSLFSLLGLSIDRFLAVNWPLLYSTSKLMTRNRARGVVVFIWVFSLILGFLGIGDPKRFHYDLDYMTLTCMLEIELNPVKDPPDLYHGIFFLMLVFFVPYLCVIIVTITTWFLLWRNFRKTCHSKKVFSDNSEEASIGSASTANQAKTATNNLEMKELPNGSNALKANVSGKTAKIKKKEKVLKYKNDKEAEQLTMVMLLMVLAFTVCVAPFLAAQADIITPRGGELKYIQLTGKNYKHRCHPILYLVVVELLYFNSLCNFFIYNLRNENFRKEIVKKRQAFYRVISLNRR